MTLPAELDFVKNTSGSPQRMNEVMEYLDARFRALEALSPDYLAAVDLIKTVGLNRLAEVLVPVFSEASGYADQLEAKRDEWVDSNLPGQLAAQATTAVINALASYRSRYWGTYASAPSVGPEGQALALGVQYFDSTLDQQRVYGSGGWKNSGSAVGGIMAPITTVTATASQTVFSVAGGYDVGYLIVTLNGVVLQPAAYTATNGTTVTLTTPAAVNDKFGGVKFGAVTLATVYNKVDADAKFRTIADSYSQAQVDLGLATKAATSDVHSKTAADARFARLSENLSDLASAPTARANLGLGAWSGPNLLINGDFRLNQRALASVGDAAYCFDAWYALVQTAAVAPSVVANPESGFSACGRLTQSQVTAQRMGIAQPIEKAECSHLRGQGVTVSGRLRLSTSDTVRYALVEHTGTADVITRDVVNSWTNGTYSAGQFFIAGVNVLAHGEIALSAGNSSPFSMLATVGATANNLILVVWTKNAVAQNVTLDLQAMKVEPGSTATVFTPRPFGQELTLAQRLYCKSFPLATTPAQNAGLSGAEYWTIAATNFRDQAVPIRFPARMRITPSITTFNPSASNANAKVLSSGEDAPGTSVAASSERMFALDVTYNGGGSGNSMSVAIHYTADASL